MMVSYFALITDRRNLSAAVNIPLSGVHSSETKIILVGISAFFKPFFKPVSRIDFNRRSIKRESVLASDFGTRYVFAKRLKRFVLGTTKATK